MLIREKLETVRILKLRYRYEPYSKYNIICVYDSVKGEFLLKWSSDDFNMLWYDKHSKSNRDAVKCMYDLLN